MGRRIPPSLCARCKGYKKLCGLPSCPILERFRVHASIAPRAQGGEVEGDTPPSVVVGEKGYPRVPLLYGIPPGVHGDEARFHDDPPGWASRRVRLRDIIRLRSSMLAGIVKAEVSRPERLYEAEISLAAVSEKPVDTEAVLASKPMPRLRFDGLLAPQGPSAPAARLRVASNPRVPRPLEKRIWDDALSSRLLVEAYQEGASVYSLVSALSLGLLGRMRSRRLVPTRWAITAVDQTISDHLLHRVRSRDTIGGYEVYHGGYLGNYFTVVLMPGQYKAEMIEVWYPLTPWTRSAKEPIVYRIKEHTSLKQSVMDGGYIAARLAVAEHLHRRGRQARVLIIREITRDYYAPVGNWHIRETMRRTLASRPETYSSLEEALAAAASKLRSATARREAEHSSLVREERGRTTLDMFIKR